MGWLNAVAPSNIDRNVVTLDVSHEAMGWLNPDALGEVNPSGLNRFDMSVIRVVTMLLNATNPLAPFVK